MRQNPGLVSTAAQILDKGMRMVSGELFGNPRIKAGVFPGQRELSSVRRDACGLIELGGHGLISFVRWWTGGKAHQMLLTRPFIS